MEFKIIPPKSLQFSHRPWEGACRRLGQSSKAAPERSMRKCQNQCAIPFDLGALEEGLSFSLKVTISFSPWTSLVPAGAFPSSAPLMQGGSDSFFEFILKLCRKKSIFLGILEKIMQKPFRCSKRTHVFSGGLACYGLWPWGPRGGVGFFFFLKKVTLFFSHGSYLGPTGVLPRSAPRPRGGYDIFLEFIPKLCRKIGFS